MDKKYTIYLLSCPITDEPRYVGQTKSVKNRYRQHCLLSENEGTTHRERWLKSLLVRDLKPAIKILETGLDCYDKAEKKWIKHYRKLGCDLVNGNDGGFDLSHAVKNGETNQERKIKLLAVKILRLIGYKFDFHNKSHKHLRDKYIELAMLHPDPVSFLEKEHEDLYTISMIKKEKIEICQKKSRYELLVDQVDLIMKSRMKSVQELQMASPCEKSVT